MTLQEAIEARHSVRAYKEQPLMEDVVRALEEQIARLNQEGKLHMQLILNEPKAFQGTLAKYGRFRGVGNYIIVAGKPSDDLDERVGYYGEQLVLFAEGERVACCISIGYGETQGAGHKIKSLGQVSNADESTPSWFKSGVEAALLAPTAVNQQKFSFEYLGMKNGQHRVRAKRGFSLIGYSKMDLGIAKCHFEIGAGKENFEWEN